MSETAQSLTDGLLARVADLEGGAHSRAFCRTILTHAQRMVNLAVPGTLQQTAFSTLPSQVIYAVDPNVVARVERVLDDTNTDLNYLPWEQFAQQDPNWMRATGGDFKLWSKLGRDYVVIWPAKPFAAAVTLIYTRVTDVVASEGDALDLREDRLPAVLALSEYLLLLRHRLETSAPAAEAALDAALARLPVAGAAAVAGYDQNG